MGDDELGFTLDPQLDPVPERARVLTSAQLNAPNIIHAFTTHQPGDKDYGLDAPGPRREQAIAALARRLHFPAARLFSVRQVHGKQAFALRSGDTPTDWAQTEADALVTDLPNTVVAVRTADCVPILVRCATPTVVAAIHAGWRGLVAGVVSQTIELMRNAFGCDSAHLRAAVGPAIGPSAYEVNADVAGHFTHLDGVVIGDTRGMRPRVDLKRAAAMQLHQLGLSMVSVAPHCTYTEADLFYSHRRAPSNKARNLSVIGIVGAGHTG